ncbi:MAG: triose-phosphate isomerase [Clostridiales bacterium]|nr:triose-phosphate isomerase [Clostridiales bacterium]
MRKPIMAGNWKMNKTPDETKAMITALAPEIEDADCTVILCTPAVCISAAQEAAKGSNIQIGAQNCHFENSGAYTAETSPATLKAIGIQYVIVGHSERRQYFAETDETVNLRAKAALSNGLTPIICVGESLAQREAGVTETLVRYQTTAALSGISAEDAASLVIAYEPIWAIGTGKTATAEDANVVCGYIRSQIADLYNKQVADAIVIQYGGSVNPKNVKELMSMENIDGGLVGGASLTAENFSQLANYNK